MKVGQVVKNKLAKTQLRFSTSGAAGVGSDTSNTAFIFDTAERNVGKDVTYTTSPTLGDSFTINADGVYSVQANLAVNAVGSPFGISIDGVASQSIAEQTSQTLAFCVATVAANVNLSMGATVWLRTGQVVRAQTSVSGTGTTSRIYLIIERLL